MLKGFRDFILRGNVVDLGVGIVIGAAFTGLVNQFTTSFLEPLVKFFSGGRGITAGALELREGVLIDWAGFVNAAITFLLTAAVLYFLVVLPMNRLAERRRRDQVAAPAEPTDEVRLLTEIRDALLAGQVASLPRQATAGEGTSSVDSVDRR